MDKLTISMVIFSTYVELPETVVGNPAKKTHGEIPSPQSFALLDAIGSM